MWKSIPPAIVCAHNLAVHYAANNSVQHTQTPNTAANNRVSLRVKRKKYTCSSIPIALSRTEPIEKSALCRCIRLRYTTP